MPRSAPPPPLSCGSALETESQTDAFVRALSGKGSSADSHPALAKHAPLAPRIRPVPPGASHRAFAAPGRVLPFFLEFMVGPGQPPTPRLPPVFLPAQGHSVPAWLGSALAPGDSGSGLSSSRRRPPPSSCRLTQPAGMGRDRLDQGGNRASACLASGTGDWGFPSGMGLTGIFLAGVRSAAKES